MREIKYRMWNKKEKKMYQVGVLDFDDEKAYIKNYLSYTVSNYMFENIELMQYTGLHDKNGKEIYEGDILPFTMYDLKTEYYYIVFRNGEFEAINKQDTNFIWRSAWKESAVIGNIYENPDLLKGADNIE
jgi:uncharacterized phage protein (TIGR01671 family)